jgi:hypothetical protein
MKRDHSHSPSSKVYVYQINHVNVQLINSNSPRRNHSKAKAKLFTKKRVNAKVFRTDTVDGQESSDRLVFSCVLKNRKQIHQSLENQEI